MKRPICWGRSVPFFLVHLVAAWVLFRPFQWSGVAVCFGSYFVRMVAITAGYHRYFSHRTFKMGRIAQFLVGLLGTASAQKGPLWWAANHRHHHKFSDLEGDVHSPILSGFFWSHVGWVLSDQFDEIRWKEIPDLAKFPELRWLDRLQSVVPWVYAGLFYSLGGLDALLWGFFVSTVLLWHGTFFINSLAHVWGQRRYRTGDGSRNNFWLALLTCGEGWHNNHHAYVSTARQGFYWWEIDVSYYLIWMASKLGIVSGVRQPPLALLESKRL